MSHVSDRVAEYTPEFYHDEETGTRHAVYDFLHQSAIEFDGIEDLTQDIPFLVQLDLIPDRFIPELAYLVGYDIDPSIPLSVHREELRKIIEIWKIRGTPAGIIRTLIRYGASANVADVIRPYDYTFTLDDSELSGEDHLEDERFWRWGTYQVIADINFIPVKDGDPNVAAIIDHTHRPVGTLQWLKQKIQGLYAIDPNDELIELQIIKHLQYTTESNDNLISDLDWLLSDNLFLSGELLATELTVHRHLQYPFYIPNTLDASSTVVHADSILVFANDTGSPDIFFAHKVVVIQANTMSSWFGGLPVNHVFTDLPSYGLYWWEGGLPAIGEDVQFPSTYQDLLAYWILGLPNSSIPPASDTVFTADRLDVFANSTTVFADSGVSDLIDDFVFLIMRD